MSDAKSVLESAVREAKVNVILDAARKVFATRDFHETRLEDIADAAGFSKASLYNYYKDKEEIFLGLAIREMTHLLFEMKRSLDPSHSLEENLRNSLRVSFTLFGENFATIIALSNFRMMRVIGDGQICEMHTTRGSEFSDVFRTVTTLFEDIIAAARARGEFESPLSDAVLNQYISSLIRGTLMGWKIAGTMGNVELEIENIVSFVKCGMAVRN